MFTDRRQLKEYQRYQYDGLTVWILVIIKAGRGYTIILVDHDPREADFYKKLYAKPSPVWRRQLPLKIALKKLQEYKEA